MTVVRLKYIHRFKDRYGKVRYYLRKPGEKRKPLPDPSDEKFFEVYNALLNNRPEIVHTSLAPAGSVSDLIGQWYQTNHFKLLRASTQAVYRRLLERMRSAEYAHLPVASMEPANIRFLLREQSDSPTTANRMLRLWGILMQYAIDLEWRDTDPTVGIRRVRTKSKGIHSWTDAEIEQYEAYWPTGSKPRLALALLLYTGQRRSDAVRIGPSDVIQGAIRLQQVKTEAPLLIPIHPALELELAHWADTGTQTFLATERGKPFSGNGFYNNFVEWCAEAGLPTGRTPHGLRKAAARRLAEAGCTTHQIAAITGHKTLAEVERYTRAVEQAKLAGDAIRRLEQIGKLRDEIGKLDC